MIQLVLCTATTPVGRCRYALELHLFNDGTYGFCPAHGLQFVIPEFDAIAGIDATDR